MRLTIPRTFMCPGMDVLKMSVLCLWTRPIVPLVSPPPLIPSSSSVHGPLVMLRSLVALSVRSSLNGFRAVGMTMKLVIL